MLNCLTAMSFATVTRRLVCLRQHFLTGSGCLLTKPWGERVGFRETGNDDLLLIIPQRSGRAVS